MLLIRHKLFLSSEYACQIQGGCPAGKVAGYFEKQSNIKLKNISMESSKELKLLFAVRK